MMVIIGLHSGFMRVHVRDVPHARRVMDTAKRHGRPAVLRWQLTPPQDGQEPRLSPRREPGR